MTLAQMKGNLERQGKLEDYEGLRKNNEKYPLPVDSDGNPAFFILGRPKSRQ